MTAPRSYPGLLAVAAVCLFALPAFAAKRTTDDDSIPPSRADRIDDLLQPAWDAAGVDPAAEAHDGEFLRRATLDFTGVIPRTSEVREFLADERPDKRARLVDRLLASPRYATHMATTWRNRILPLGENPERTREALALQKWLRTQFADNQRYDRIVGGLLLASGENEFGPALYFQANDLAPEKLAGSAAELFLGVDLHCAQCHDHPFADWSQRDFWGFAAFFARVKSADGTGMMDRPNASFRLVDLDRGEVTLPDSDEVVPPRFPRGQAADDDEYQTRRSQLVVWLTSRDNNFFARTAVNVAWEHLFGRPLVEAVDADDDSLQAELLDELATEFVDSGFDLQQLWRTLAASRAYQLSSRHDESAAAQPELFARMLPKPLTPEQLYDSVQLLAPSARTPAQQEGDAAPPDTAAGFDEDSVRIEFVRRMRTPPGDPTEYRAGTLQALMLMNGRLTDDATAHDRSSLLGAVLAPYMSDDDRVDALFLATLARAPDEAERAAFLGELRLCETPSDRGRALSDMLWALVNTTEFAFNR